MAGLAATDPRNVVVSTAMRMAPDNAVPRGAPMFVTVFWTPPTSPLWESGTAETVTLPKDELAARRRASSSPLGVGHGCIVAQRGFN